MEEHYSLLVFSLPFACPLHLDTHLYFCDLIFRKGLGVPVFIKKKKFGAFLRGEIMSLTVTASTLCKCGSYFVETPGGGLLIVRKCTKFWEACYKVQTHVRL